MMRPCLIMTLEEMTKMLFGCVVAGRCFALQSSYFAVTSSL